MDQILWRCGSTSMQMKPQDGNPCLPPIVLSTLPSKEVKHENKEVKLTMNLEQPVGGVMQVTFFALSQ